MPLEETLFLKNWRTAIDEVPKRPNRMFMEWEGDQAYRDLKRTELLAVCKFEKRGKPLFLGERDWRARLLLRQLHNAVEIYESESNLRPTKKNSRVINISQTLEQLKRFTELRPGKRLTRLADALISELTKELQYRSGLEIEKRDNKFFDGLVGFGAAVREYARAPKRKYDADARFQIKIGFLLCSSLAVGDPSFPHLGFRTISRLVVLFYWAAGLAKLKGNRLAGDERLVIPGRWTTVKGEKVEQILSVDSVDQNLRRASLQKLFEALNNGPGIPALPKARPASVTTQPSASAKTSDSSASAPRVTDGLDKSDLPQPC